MKIRQQELEFANPVAKSIVPTPTPATQPKVVNVTYDLEKAHLERPDSELKIAHHSHEYIANTGWRIVVNLKEALIARANGVLAFSPREADIVARGHMNLASAMFQQMLTRNHFGTYLTEGVAVERNNAFELRAIVNKGLQWKLHTRDTATLEMQQKGDAKLAAAIKALEDKWLHLWPEEVLDGFEQDLLKPEWQTWGQFNYEKQRQVREGSFDE